MACAAFLVPVLLVVWLLGGTEGLKQVARVLAGLVIVGLLMVLAGFLLEARPDLLLYAVGLVLCLATWVGSQ
jgi:hypothetical protein